LVISEQASCPRSLCPRPHRIVRIGRLGFGIAGHCGFAGLAVGRRIDPIRLAGGRLVTSTLARLRIASWRGRWLGSRGRRVWLVCD
jgi:hypothetical protein